VIVQVPRPCKKASNKGKAKGSSASLMKVLKLSLGPKLLSDKVNGQKNHKTFYAGIEHHIEIIVRADQIA
jgi:hypothetical protein